MKSTSSTEVGTSLTDGDGPPPTTWERMTYSIRYLDIYESTRIYRKKQNVMNSLLLCFLLVEKPKRKWVRQTIIISRGFKF